MIGTGLFNSWDCALKSVFSPCRRQSLSMVFFSKKFLLQKIGISSGSYVLVKKLYSRFRRKPREQTQFKLVFF